MHSVKLFAVLRAGATFDQFLNGISTDFLCYVRKIKKIKGENLVCLVRGAYRKLDYQRFVCFRKPLEQNHTF